MTGIVNSTGARSGIVGTTVGTPAGGGIENATWMRLETTLTSDANDAIPNWQIQHGSTGNIGTLVTEASGHFTFPQTGMWLIIYNPSYYSPALKYYIESRILAAEDYSGSSGTFTYQARSFSSTYHPGSGDDFYASSSVTYIFDVEDVATHKAALGMAGAAATADMSIIGTADTLEGSTSHVLFMRIGDT